MAKAAGLFRVVPKKRNLELFMLLFGFGIYAFELSQVQLATIQILREDAWFIWALPVVAATIFHLVLRFKASDADPIILPIGFILNSLGIAMIYRLDLVKSAVDADRAVSQRQVVWTVIAILLGAAVLWLVRSHLTLENTFTQAWLWVFSYWSFPCCRLLVTQPAERIFQFD